VGIGNWDEWKRADRGKTAVCLHTLRWQGPDSDPGVNTRALRRLFEVIKEREEDYR
jgi:hypothetical protein